jgi:CO/xanthine dehydrogenase FAD-binding subunit
VIAAYSRPDRLSDALAQAAAGARVLAGGTDLYPATARQSLAGPLVDVTGIAELAGIAALPSGGLRIGACTTWAAIAAAPLPPALHALQAAARTVGGRQIQTCGTLGGNLCNASPAADGVPPLLAVAAEVELAGPAGRRLLPLAEFLRGPRRTALGPGEVMVAVHVPGARPSSSSARGPIS